MAFAVHRCEHVEGHVPYSIEGAHLHAGLVAVTDRVDAPGRGGGRVQQPTDRRVDLRVDRDDSSAVAQRREHHRRAVVEGPGRLHQHVDLAGADREVGVAGDHRGPAGERFGKRSFVVRDHDVAGRHSCRDERIDTSCDRAVHDERGMEAREALQQVHQAPPDVARAEHPDGDRPVFGGAPRHARPGRHGAEVYETRSRRPRER